MKIDWDSSNDKSHGSRSPTSPEPSPIKQLWDNITGHKDKPHSSAPSTRPATPRRSDTYHDSYHSSSSRGDSYKSTTQPDGTVTYTTYNSGGRPGVTIVMPPRQGPRPTVIVLPSGAATPRRTPSRSQSYPVPPRQYYPTHSHSPSHAQPSVVRSTNSGTPTYFHGRQVVGDPEAVKQYVNSQTNVEKWLAGTQTSR